MIKKIVGEKPAYFVGGVPHLQDIQLSCLTGFAFLSGNPVINAKFTQSFFTKRFLEINDFPYMVFSQKIKKEKDIETNLAKMIIENPGYSDWRIEIDGENFGRGTCLLSAETFGPIQSIRDTKNYTQRVEKLDEVAYSLKKYLPSYCNFSCNQLFFSFQNFKDVLLAKGGFVEAVPKGRTKTIGMVGFIDPNGKSGIITSYEVFQTERFFKLGYIWPQTDLPRKSIQGLIFKLYEKLYDQGLFGYVTILLNVTIFKNREYKVCIDRIIPYYDEFLSVYESLKFMLPENYPQTSLKKPTFQAICFPRVSALPVPPDTSVFQFFQTMNQSNLIFSQNPPRGPIFSGLASFPNCLGLVCLGSSLREVAREASRTCSALRVGLEGRRSNTDREDGLSFMALLESVYSLEQDSR